MYQSMRWYRSGVRHSGTGFIASAGAPGGWTIGLNFRSTSGFVTDGTDEIYVLATDFYPVNRVITFGWLDAGINAADRDSGIDRRLAGINYRLNTGGSNRFQVDLPAPGSYTIRLALGDAGGAQGYQYLEFRDDTTAFATITDTDGTLEDHFDDATGTDRTLAAWPGSNTSITQIFTTTTFIVAIGSPATQTGASTIAHLQITQN